MKPFPNQERGVNEKEREKEREGNGKKERERVNYQSHKRFEYRMYSVFMQT